MVQRSQDTANLDCRLTKSTLAAVSRVLGVRSRSVRLALVLFCFLGRNDISPALCARGATARKRWADSGGIDETNADLDSELALLLADSTALLPILHELQLDGIISIGPNNTFCMNLVYSVQILKALPEKLHRFWRLKALLFASHTIPWEYLEPEPTDMSTEFAHLQHTLFQIKYKKIYLTLDSNMKVEVISSLLEASKFTDVECRLSAVACAKEIMIGLKSRYLKYYVAYKESLALRLSGDVAQAKEVLGSILPIRGGYSSTRNVKTHSARGHILIQRALDYSQASELDKAIELLNGWGVTSRRPSPIESTVLFRKHLLMGELVRYRGGLNESLSHLQRSERLIDVQPELSFAPYRTDLFFNIGSTLIELDEFSYAESQLRKELLRQAKEEDNVAPLLNIVLAESIFAQKRYAEAQLICQEVAFQAPNSEREKLHLLILLAKIFHARSDWSRAYKFWNVALHKLGQFFPTYDHITMVIIESLCDIARRQGLHSLQLEFEERLSEFGDRMESLKGRHWIAGLNLWLDGLPRSLTSAHLYVAVAY
ncbi:hypothetical protein GTR04_2805 [Trichophyton interdigitale]|uniref:Uncharacterized protein n=1 Tax=Trichophyton interdigitale TaxID=101480 RepID=A0A9P4YI80_9EURO|nr:hypothetical protein GY631_2626 [Trichophyton interdigitale]KAF3897507.1 hypothetical protein GY632_2259 [Trichophyton interdigitale]KAG8209828.1 hypothetical protein GTR04_2805 [Trichophyton interdigitale]